VQSIYFPPFEGEEIFITSFSITGKWEDSSDNVDLFIDFFFEH
jgi:hypothetical protein